MNTDRWEPEARKGYGGYPFSPYISSAEWADHYIINDDNFGMYVTLPTRMMRNFLVPKHNPNLHAHMAIGIVPADVSIGGYDVEIAAAQLASRIISASTPTHNNRWFQYLKDHPQLLVCRTMLAQKQEYINALSLASSSCGGCLGPQEIAGLNANLPDRCWMTELSLPDLYTTNKHKIGDILYTSDPTDAECKSDLGVAFAWMPGLMHTRPDFYTTQHPWPISGHIPLFRLNGAKPPVLEW